MNLKHLSVCVTCGARPSARERCMCDSHVQCDCGRPAIPALGFCHVCKRKKRKSGLRLAWFTIKYHRDPKFRERYLAYQKAYKAVISDTKRRLPMALNTSPSNSQV